MKFSAPDFDANKLPIWVFLIDWNMLVKGIFASGVAISLKLAKDWYLQQLENNRLAKQESQNKMWLLKSQIQPEFLFYSLKALYKKIDTSTEESINMILRLSDILSYILYDCNEEHVPLHKELAAAQELVALENMNDEKDISITIGSNNNYQHKLIAPLTLFSFIRHQICKRGHNYFIGISIDIKESVLNLTASFKNKFAEYDKKGNQTEGTNDQQEDFTAGFFEYNVIRNDPRDIFRIEASTALAETEKIKDNSYDTALSI